MQGDELKAIRRAAGLSQAEMGEAIGMARETIGAMERGASIEKRTELAVRFVAGQRPVNYRTTMIVQRDISDVLEGIKQRRMVSAADLDELQAGQKDWFAAGGTAPGTMVLQQLLSVGIALTNPAIDTLTQAMFARDFYQLAAMWDTLREEPMPTTGLAALL